MHFRKHQAIINEHCWCGCSSMVEHQPSKLDTWVRFPSPAFLLPFLWREICWHLRLWFPGASIPQSSRKSVNGIIRRQRWPGESIFTECYSWFRFWCGKGCHGMWQYLKKPEIILNFLFLGVGASALGFFLWNLSTKWIGAIKTSVYIYVSPVVTVVLSVVILHEKMTFVSVTGALLILLGLIVSQKKINQKK